MTRATYTIADIKVGERHRRDMGDIDALAASMTADGLLQPVVITPDGQLIAGERRLRAAQQIGWTEIPVTVVDIADIVRGEYVENTIRKDFTLSEAVAIKRALEPAARAAARERMCAGRPLEKFSEGRALDKIAKATGVHRTTLAKAEAVVDAAKAEPERFGKLLADMDRTGRVNGVFKRLKVAKQAERIRAEPPPLPGNGPYRIGVVDCPWPHEPQQEDPSHRAVRPYLTRGIEQIIGDLRWLPGVMHADSVLWFWCTNFHLIRYAAPVLDSLGFAERSILTWVKSHFGHGDLLRSQTEHCIMAVRGKPTVTLTNESTVLFAPARGHSVKPPESYDLVERLCPAPRYLDVYSRYRHNEKWDCYGDEAPAAAQPGAPPLDAIPGFLQRST